MWVRVQLQSLKTSDFAPASSKEFLDTQGTIECGFTLKRVRDMIRTYNYYGVRVNKYGVKCGTSLRFWENKGWIKDIDPYGWFQWYCRYHLGRRSSDDSRQIKRWLGIVNRFKCILVKMIKDKGTKFDDFSVSPKMRQILLHWGYELVESKC